MLIVRWLWSRRSISARIARLALLPPSVAFRVLTAARARGYRSGLLPSRSASVPTVGVGNLTVGGSGKTPIAAWIAAYFADHHRRPGIVLRGYGADEGAVHRRLVPTAIVVEHADRLTACEMAVRRGAEVIVLDDAFQRLDIRRDLNVAVVSAESSRAVPWTLPAGPWREGWRALKRADLIVITRKRAAFEVSTALAARAAATAPGRPVAIARLGIAQFHGLVTGAPVDAAAIEGRRVLASAGIADPDTLAAQCRAIGADVSLMPWEDHHPYSTTDIRELVLAGRRVDYVVVTEKDAVKLRHRWPGHRPEPLVASLNLVWERGQTEVERALQAVVSDVDALLDRE